MNRSYDDDYTERHHIIPRSLGGDNQRENIVRLSARAHFLAHWLLTKFTEGNDRYKMLHAMSCMRRRVGCRSWTSWQYAIVKEAQAEASSHQWKGRIPTPRMLEATKLNVQKMIESNRGRKQTPDHVQKRDNSAQTEARTAARKHNVQRMIASNVGRKHSEEFGRSISNRMRGKVFTEEHILNLSLSHKGKRYTEAQRLAHQGLGGWKLSEETKAKISVARKLRSRLSREAVEICE
jgi:hypothetical protein